MSITTRLWTDEDLKQIGKDKWLTTIFMNAKTFSDKEIRYYPYQDRKEYIAFVDTHEEIPENEPITFYATDNENAIRFIMAEYNTESISAIDRVITTYKTIYNRE
jgi:hypothetical protein